MRTAQSFPPAISASALRVLGCSLVAAAAAVLLQPRAAVAAQVASVVQVNGAPTVTRAGKTGPVVRGASIEAKDIVETDAVSKVKLLLADDSVLAIGPRTRIAVEELGLDGARRGRLQVFDGRFKLAIAYFIGSTDYEITTPTAVAGVRGTVLWGDTDLDAICALEGTIEVRPLAAASGGARLRSGGCVRHMSQGVTDAFEPSAEELAAYLKEVTLD